MEEIIKTKFEELFGNEGDIKEYFAPGRVNLIGEHTDYNGGHVFPCALTMGTYAVARKRNDNKLRLYSMNFEKLGVLESTIDNLRYNPKEDWINYPKSMIWAMKDEGFNIDKGFDIVYYGTIPNSSGLSSSASIEVLTGFVLKDLFNLDLDMIKLALLGQKAENKYVGVNCGIMDQFASVFGNEGCLMRLDCRSREFEYFPFNPQGYKLCLVNSKVKHELAGSPYNDRRNSCENVVKHIAAKHPEAKFETLRDCTWEQLEEVRAEVGEEDYSRAHFVLGEKDRVLAVCDALEKGDYETVGQKMYETHYGLSKEYEVSCEELDFLNDLAKENGVTGSRIMGGGFGGCTINLVKDDIYDKFVEDVTAKFTAKYGHAPEIYPVVISEGSHKVC